MKQTLLSFLLALLPMVTHADVVEIDSIYYNLIPKGKVAEVTSNPNKYIGAIEIPKKVTYDGVTYDVTGIGVGAFYDCSGLTSLTIPNSVTSIGGSAFWGCTSLTSINIPNSVTYIEDSAFHGCRSLASVVIPNSVISIGNYAFQSCSGIKSVTIGCGLRVLDSYSFAKCPEIEDVYCYAETVPGTQTDTFKDSYIEYATLHVPAGSLDNYKKKDPWSIFKTIVAIDHIKGDANSDNDVNADDITELANAIIGKPSDKYKKEAADINNDGVVDIQDVTLLIDILPK